MSYIIVGRKKLQSTPSVGRATSTPPPTSFRPSYFYPRPPWGGRQATFTENAATLAISIHALRGEGDHTAVVEIRRIYMDFYPRPPWGGRRYKRKKAQKSEKFLSTPSVGRATVRLREVAYDIPNFYPRPPWGGRRKDTNVPTRQGDFYPRPPWGGRPPTPKLPPRAHRFLSTPSVGRATRVGHAGNRLGYNFYPRPPWGGRRGPAVTICRL